LPAVLLQYGFGQLGEVNLWYGQLYAAATGRKAPGPGDLVRFFTPPVDAPLLRQIAPAPAHHPHRAHHPHAPAAPAVPATAQTVPPPPAKAVATAAQNALEKQEQTMLSIAEWIPKYIHQYQVDTIPRISAFLGNAAVESAGFTKFEEDLYFTHEAALRSAHRAAFPTEKSTDGYLRNPEALANRVYCSEFHPSLGNGPFGNGNGWRYRGRGIIQITGLTNYRQFSEYSGIDAVGNPDILANPEGAVVSAFWYWKSKGLNKFADSYVFEELGRTINGVTPPYAWADRERYRLYSARRIIERMLADVF
jgi:putative chitinase